MTRTALGPADAATNTARAMLAFRRSRARELPAGLFSEFGWEFLLELFVADGESRRLTGRDIAKYGDVPELTASRWLKHLSAEGLVVGDGNGDLDDQLTLSGEGLSRMEALLKSAEQLGDELSSR